MSKVKLGEIATILISNVDKKTYPNQRMVRLCNYVDVYHNWAISDSITKSLMFASASDNEFGKYTLKKGYVALTKDSETKDDIGISTYIATSVPDIVLGYHCALIKPNNNILDGAYLNAFLHTAYARKHFELNASGSGQRYTLTADAIGELVINLPPLDEQVKIARLFTCIDKKIENNKRINDNLAA